MRLVTRLDLATPGSVLAQTVHAAFEFALQHPEETQKWNLESNYVVSLSVKDEAELMDLVEKLKLKGIKHTLFREPDLGDQATSVCIQPSDDARKLCSGLPLAFKSLQQTPVGMTDAVNINNSQTIRS